MTPSRFQIPMRIKVLEEYCLIRAKSGFIFHILHFTFSMFAEILSDPSGEWARTALMWGPEPRPLRVMRLPTWNSATTFPGPLNSSANHNSSQAQKYCVLWSAPRLLVYVYFVWPWYLPCPCTNIITLLGLLLRHWDTAILTHFISIITFSRVPL